MITVPVGTAPPTAGRRAFLGAFAIALVIALPHIIAAPGYTTVPWGDYGRWLHETERFANGEVLYRDFTWPFPPLSLWVVGGWMKLFGTGLTSVQVLASLIMVAILACYAYLITRTVATQLRAFVLVPSVVLALALAQRESASLALGMYTPAAPMAILLLLATLALMLREGKTRTQWGPTIVGVLCGAMVLTKQDVWLPAIFLAVVSRSRATLASAAATVLTGMVIVAATAGASVLPGVLTGFNQVQEFGSLGMPDGESLVIAALATAAMGMVFAWSVGSGLRPLVAFGLTVLVLTIVYLAQSLAAQMDTREALIELGRRAATQVPPLFFPVFLGALLILRRRTVTGFWPLLGMLVFVGLTRARRGFQFAEWYHALLELPVYTIIALALAPGIRTVRRLQWAFAALLLVAFAEEWTLGRVPLIGIGRLAAHETPRGTVHWRPYEVSRMQWLAIELAARDPGAQRPLFAFGYTGGYSYFLNRTNPTGMPFGFRLSRFDPDSVVQALENHDPPVFALDSREYDSVTVPRPGLWVFAWKRPRVPNHYVRYDRAYFDKLLAHCQPVAWFPDPSQPTQVLHSCGTSASPSTPQ